MSSTLVLKVLKTYSHFGIYSSPSGLINTIANQFPALIFAGAFSPFFVGQFMLANRLVLMPSSLIGRSIGKVFLGQATDRNHSGELPSLINRSLKKLATIRLALSLFLLISASFASSIFGPEWNNLKWIIPMLIPLFIGKIIVAPLRNAFLAAQKNNFALFAQCALALITLFPVFIFQHSLTFVSLLFVYSASFLVRYLAYLFILYWKLCSPVA